MSRAFTKERDDAPEPRLTVRRDEPTPITPAGLRRLEQQMAAAADPAERARLAAVLAAVYAVEPPEDRSVVALGATVTLDVPGRGEQRFTIVGEDETDVAQGRIGVGSPLALALLGARAGAVVTWARPAGSVDVVVKQIAYDEGDNGR